MILLQIMKLDLSTIGAVVSLFLSVGGLIFGASKYKFQSDQHQKEIDLINLRIDKHRAEAKEIIEKHKIEYNEKIDRHIAEIETKFEKFTNSSNNSISELNRKIDILLERDQKRTESNFEYKLELEKRLGKIEKNN